MPELTVLVVYSKSEGHVYVSVDQGVTVPAIKPTLHYMRLALQATACRTHK